MAYNVAGLNAQGPAARTRPLPDSSHLGRQTAGENNPRLTPLTVCDFCCRNQITSRPSRKFPLRYFFRSDALASLDVNEAAQVASKIALLRILVHNTPAVLCAVRDRTYSGLEGKNIMKHLFPGKLSVVLVVLLAASCPAQEAPAARPQDASSIDALILASYAAISHPAGKAADMQRFSSLFRPGAQLISASDQDGKPALRSGSIGQITRMLQSTQHQERSHFEKEIARRTEQYGKVAHVWSTYESTDTENGRQTHVRGINSISLVNDGRRWWIVSAQWQNESAARPIPRQYLKGRR